MSKPARKAVAVAPKRASKTRKNAAAADLVPPMAAPQPFAFTYNPEAEKPILGCPFVRARSDIGVEPGTGGWWCVPSTTGYDVGWRIGSIMGRFYLLAIAKEGGRRTSGSHLSAIILDLMERLAGVDRRTEAGMEEHYSLRGQLYGFLEMVERASVCGARDHAESFTKFDTEKAIRLANAGLILDEKEYYKKKDRMYRLRDQMAAMPGAEIMAGHHLDMLSE